jgi:hypothetical protein
MFTQPFEEQSDAWATLQNRPCTSDPDEDAFHVLLGALDVGWWIEPPVYVRPRWGSEHAGQQRYHFILRRDNRMTMLSVADSSQVRTFVHEYGLQVNASAN